MFYDFHIHSALSPCANDDMTPNNIVNMSYIKGLEMISVCDHNSVKQQEAIKKVADQLSINYICGIEVQTREEVHVLCYFEELDDCLNFGKWVEEKLLPIPNDINYFGHQLILNELDEVVDEEKILLLQSIDADINEVSRMCHQHHGMMILAHVCDRANSIITQLGFIPFDLEFDGCEIKSLDQKRMIEQTHPYLKNDLLWLCDSDAHQLIDIHEAEYQVSRTEMKMIWRKYI